jgi:hypothetical protein
MEGGFVMCYVGHVGVSVIAGHLKGSSNLAMPSIGLC